MSGHQQTIYTIHESQLNGSQQQQQQAQANNNGNNNGQQGDILIDTSSIPVTQQAGIMPPLQHHQHLLPADHTITSQPMAGGSSRVAPEAQGVVYSVHPVFSQLERHDALLVRQRADPTSTCCGFESANTYTVRAKDGTPILKAVEDSNCCERCCFEGNREYSLALVAGEEVVARIRKPYRVSRLCCYSNAARIESPEDNPVGHVRQLFTLFGHPRYAVYDCQQPPNAPSFLIESTSCRLCCTPCLCGCLCPNRQFRIVDRETREEVGTIARDWPQGDNSMTKEPQQQQPQAAASPDDDPFQGRAHDGPAAGHQTFGVQFVANLEARHKVLLLSACFMMDFFYFESDRRRRKLASC